MNLNRYYLAKLVRVRISLLRQGSGRKAYAVNFLVISSSFKELAKPIVAKLDFKVFSPEGVDWWHIVDAFRNNMLTIDFSLQHVQMVFRELNIVLQ